MLHRGSGSSPFTAEVDHVGRDEWSALLRRFDDAHIVQTWDFAGAIAPHHRVSRLVLRKDRKAVALAQIRVMTVPLISRGIAQVSFGPLWRRRGSPPDRRVFEAAVAALREEYVLRRRLHLRLFPYMFCGEIDDSVGTFACLGFEKSIDSSGTRTIVLDLSKPPGDIRNAFDKDMRRRLKRAEESTLEIRHGTSLEMFEALGRIYQEMLFRKGLEPAINLRRWANLQAALPETDKPSVFLVYAKGEAVSGMAVSFLGDTGYTILAATTETALRCNASHLMWWQAISRSKDMGCRRYDLVGIDPEQNPGTYNFKKQFCGTEVSLAGLFENCDSAASAILVRLGVPIKNMAERWTGIYRKWRGRSAILRFPGSTPSS